MQNGLRLEMQNISKHFGGVKALTDVTLQIKPGEIHALVGENGAGKSTLMKILSGAYQKDAGKIFLNGEEVNIHNPKSAIDLGIAVIYQEFMLAPDLTVAENIFIDRLAEGRKVINWRSLKKNAKEQLSKLGFDDIDPSTRVGELSVAYQQVVEICKCLTRNARILVLDEPTAVLTFTEIDKLFSIVRKLREEGVSVIYISHRLEEVFELCDSVTVLKDGGLVGQMATSEVDKSQLITKMVGRDLTQLFPQRNAEIGDVVLSVKNLKSPPVVQDVSLEVRAGEVLGLCGLVGAGRTEAMRVVFGIDKKESGSVFLFGEEVNFKHPKFAIESGLGMLPEDRKKQGLILEQSIEINATLASLKKVRNGIGIINYPKEKRSVEELLGSLATKYGAITDNVNSLSGGNQQKVALAKWLAADSRCIILDEPTRGVDVGAKIEIYKIINELAESGVAVVMVSSEMPEIIGMCDRALVLRLGRVVGEVSKDELTENNLIKLAMGA